MRSILVSPMLISIVFGALLSGCSETDVALNYDPDLDGLANFDEAAAGTDPYNPDSDGDGQADGDEVAGGSDPMAPDYPQGWPMGECRNDIVENIGNNRGDLAQDFELLHVDGTPVRLHDFCDQAVLLVTSAPFNPG